ncbi:polyprenyl synthetase family protein [Microbispora bryophytorum]|uniref:Geranylgeranyl pyrophosphate synthase n=1 Tax=Microbispora bryophytorum TaxID=1460882 RepID=A0A8H9GWT6_9ACTN|nr:polyprenyl synthetase family protein [Microbispora bryophytorum]MBD3135551.1 polyprenyl synthetase family protein [Microbispora bryophytorum]TQS09735.1 polyprenyl synthetase family protein [Microbispora bryophytorum]GGN98241.1 geranylgeranyl pyrophosphate synthase [Microbispora bryophytorum]
MAAPPVVDIPLVDERLADDLAGGLAAVEKLLRSSVESEDAFVTQTSRHLIEAGGKRFRAMLVLLAAQFGNPDAPGIVPGAVVIELTHLATLYHDDVMDEAPVRRGSPSANARWDNTVAILTGDYLFAQASEILADLGSELIRIQARTFSRLVRGQIRETIGPAEGRDAIAHYISVLADKTGSLIATSGRFGAMLAGASADVVERLTDACEAIGVAWQLGDDLIDVAAPTADSGKTPGTDLREGVRTLPVLHALASDDPGDARLRTLLSGPVAEEDVDEALTLLRANRAMEQAREELTRWIDRAKEALAGLPEIPARTALVALCDYVVERTG